ncbi:MAG: DEAD/DEAH box helicase [Candidatus Nezhaarchaeales archaeon]
MSDSKIVKDVIEFLKSRHHPENPHISVLAPPDKYTYSSLWRNICRDFEKVEFEDEDEEAFMEEAETIQVSRFPGWMFGSDVIVHRTGEDAGVAEVRFSFYVRLDVDAEERSQWREDSYVEVEIGAILRETAGTDVVLEIKRQTSVLERLSGHDDDKLSSRCHLTIAVFGSQESLGKLGEDSLKRVVKEQIARSAEAELSVIKVPIRPGLLDVSLKLDRGQNEYRGSCHHTFALVFGTCGEFLKAYLLNLGCVARGDKELVRHSCENPHRLFIYDSSDNRWILGHLMEVEGVLRFAGGWTHGVRWTEYGMTGAHPVNTLVIVENNRTIRLRDYDVREEVLQPIEESERSAGDFLNSIASKLSLSCKESEKFASVLNSLARALDMIGVKKLYRYQEESIETVLTCLGLLGPSEGCRAVSIMARTAGGKTLAFFIPLIIYTAYERLCKDSPAERGVTAILAYPTKALANDQVEEIAHILYHLQKVSNFVVSFGVLHGNTPSIYEADARHKAEQPTLPVTCPEHKKSISIEISALPNETSANAKCEGDCDFARFLNIAMRKTREEIYYDPPNFLITDEDMINRILSGARRWGGKSPGGKLLFAYEWGLFGYPYSRCQKCRYTYPLALNVRRCPACGSKSIENIQKLPKLRVVVLDEAHQIYGSFGVQVHHMLSLLNHVLGATPLFILSSATLGRVKEFASSLLGIENPDEIRVIQARTGRGGHLNPAHKRTFVFIMPKTYTRDATMVRMLEELVRVSSDKPNGSALSLRGVIFTNSLGESNEAIQALRNSIVVSNRIVVDGHSTDYEGRRIEVENDFKQGKIDWLVATSTLELGVDYGVIDFVVIYGMPTRITSFVQRIGRAGRRRDATVFIVFNPDLPHNYTLYENYALLYDENLREKAIEKEMIVISPSNIEAVRRATERWLAATINLMCSRHRMKEACEIVTGTLSAGQQASKAWTSILDSADYGQALKTRPRSIQALIDLSPKVYDALVNREVTKLINRIRANGSNIRTLRDLTMDYEDRLYTLRVADEEVTVKYPENLIPPEEAQRSRELRYVVRHALKGQVVSYRGLFYMVSDVSSKSITPIREFLKTTRSE